MSFLHISISFPQRRESIFQQFIVELTHTTNASRPVVGSSNLEKIAGFRLHEDDVVASRVIHISSYHLAHRSRMFIPC